MFKGVAQKSWQAEKNNNQLLAGPPAFNIGNTQQNAVFSAILTDSHMGHMVRAFAGSATTTTQSIKKREKIMEIRVSGRHVDISDAFRSHVEERIENAVSKYFQRSISANITLSKQGHLFIADCQLHANQGVNLQSRGQAPDGYASVDDAVEKVEKQLRRYKRRLKNHHSHSHRDEQALQRAQSYVIAPEDEGDDLGEEAVIEDQPIIIAETSTEIPEVSVGDAVMLMDLNDVPAMMFRNSQNKELNVVYRRSDGNIGWIDPTPNA